MLLTVINYDLFQIVASFLINFTCSAAMCPRCSEIFSNPFITHLNNPMVKEL